MIYNADYLAVKLIIFKTNTNRFHMKVIFISFERTILIAGQLITDPGHNVFPIKPND